VIRLGLEEVAPRAAGKREGTYVEISRRTPLIRSFEEC
jgi:hypothetical protein